MVRYTSDQFLTEYTKFLTKINNNKTGAIELTFKRYDAASEQNLPATNDKTGVPKTPTIKKKKLLKGNQRGAANPENNKKPANPVKKTQSKPSTTTTSPDGETTLQEPSVLIRARFGDAKVSCVVPTKDIADFNEQFRTIFRLYNKNLVQPGQGSERLKKRKEASKKGKSTTAPKK